MSSERPQISIVVPVYNPGSYLVACLESIAGQTIFDQLEVILVDDGSTDGSQDACDVFAAEHPNARVIHQPNRGLSAVRNAGMDAARAGYLLFVDSDDEIVPNACEVLLAAARSSGADSFTVRGMRMLAGNFKDDPHVVSGESGAAGFGAFASIMLEEGLAPVRAELGLGPDSKVLCFSTEGDTDPVRYKQIVWDGVDF